MSFPVYRPRSKPGASNYKKYPGNTTTITITFPDWHLTRHDKFSRSIECQNYQNGTQLIERVRRRDSHDAAHGPRVGLVAVAELLQHLRGDVVRGAADGPVGDRGLELEGQRRGEGR